MIAFLILLAAVVALVVGVVIWAMLPEWLDGGGEPFAAYEARRLEELAQAQAEIDEIARKARKKIKKAKKGASV